MACLDFLFKLPKSTSNQFDAIFEVVPMQPIQYHKHIKCTLRPTIGYKITFNNNTVNLSIPFFLDFLKEQQTVKIKTVKFIFYQDGEEVEILNNTEI